MTSRPSATTRLKLSSGSEFERTYSYSRAVVVGSHVYVSGTTGYDYATSTLAATPEEQTTQLFRNVETVLDKAGASLKDVVRVRMYVSDPAHYEPIMQIFARTFADICPACTTVEAKLFDPAIFIEMDMDAVLDERS